MRRWSSLSLALLAAVAVLCWAEAAGARSWVYVAKPLATLLVIAQVVPLARAGGDRHVALMTGGFVLSLAGDVLLMLPGDRFVAGLAAFLAAHLCYIAAFVRAGGFATGAQSGGALASVGVVLLALLWPGLGAMRAPVLAYTLVILVMAWQAVEGARRTVHAGAWWAAAGALCFVASDAMLALERFRGPFPLSRLAVLGSYYVAQWMLATSVRVRAGDVAR